MESKMPLIVQYELHQRLYNNVLEGFTDVESNRRPFGSKEVNHVKYLAGHMLNSQYGLALIAGLDPTIKWNDLFAVMGQSKARDDYSYPDIEEIKEEWNQLYEPVKNGLKKLNFDDLKQKPPAPFDQVANSLVELWAFINHHQAYHIGQAAILRKVFGKKPMSFQ